MGTIPASLVGLRKRGRHISLVALRRLSLAVVCAAISCCAASSLQAQAPQGSDVGGQKLQLVQPLDGATVRETVPIRISRSVMPANGYGAILIDGLFRTARVVPSKGDVLYDWDTKASYTTPDNPDQPQFTQDGLHTIDVQIFDHDGTLVGVAESHVRLANKITSMPDGVRLVYRWRQDQTQVYKYHSSMMNDNSNTGGGKDQIQQSDLKFDRTVEDTTGGEYLIRDLVEPNGWLVDRGNPVQVQAAYNLKSRYRTVNSAGVILVNNIAFTPGDHFSFPIPQFPDRRVNVGDSWESHIQVALGWSALRPTTITGTAKLDSFEWQNGYPTAKIIETYDGPASFNLDAGDQANAQGQPAAVQPVDANNVHIDRTIWFAYNSGRVVKIDTNMTVNADMSSDQVAAIGGTAGAGGVGPVPAAGGQPSGIPGGVPGGYGPPPGFVPPGGGMPAGMMYGRFGPGGRGFGGPMMPPGFAGGMPPGFAGGMPPGYMGGAPATAPNVNQTQPKAPQKLELTDTTSLIGVH
jgi:hypothetical protein